MHLLDEVVKRLVLVVLSPALFVLLVSYPVHQGKGLQVFVVGGGVESVAILGAHSGVVSHVVGTPEVVFIISIASFLWREGRACFLVVLRDDQLWTNSGNYSGRAMVAYLERWLLLLE